MSEDSSSEEDVSKFQEAVDEKLTLAFTTNDTEITEKGFPGNKVSLPSLRNTKDDDKFFSDHRSIQVTPEFQKFVAKKLESALERFLDGSESNTIEKKSLKTKRKKRNKVSMNSGIKLFKSSADVLKEFQGDISEGENGTKVITKKKTGTNSIKIYNETEELEKARTVAVDPDVVLNGKDTAAWSTDVKGEVITVKKTSNYNEFHIEQNGYIPPEAWSGRINRFIL